MFLVLPKRVHSELPAPSCDPVAGSSEALAEPAAFRPEDIPAGPGTVAPVELPGTVDNPGMERVATWSGQPAAAAERRAAYRCQMADHSGLACRPSRNLPPDQLAG